MSPLLREAVSVAREYVGIREAGGRNRGPTVDVFLRAVGLDPTRGSYPWCAAFVHFVFMTAARRLGIENPCPRTASVMKLWGKAAWARTEAISPGCVFIMDKGGGRGHTGIVVDTIAGTPGAVLTVEGNTNMLGHRDGDGVYARQRALFEIRGYLDLSKSRPAPAVT